KNQVGHDNSIAVAEIEQRVKWFPVESFSLTGILEDIDPHRVRGPFEHLNSPKRTRPVHHHHRNQSCSPGSRFRMSDRLPVTRQKVFLPSRQQLGELFDHLLAPSISRGLLLRETA